ncbi:hypothetical protein [Nocardia farcinica]|uniref:hypothetical protein n=1 Tax=Nocardia farcinica TaxID=37329 RepID=UPI0024551A13|nr:hypothetical protein [Nocardia farcinica]
MTKRRGPPTPHPPPPRPGGRAAPAPPPGGAGREGPPLAATGPRPLVYGGILGLVLAGSALALQAATGWL